MRAPLSTYRIQFNKDFGFQQAISIVKYLYELGISDIYASPVFKAKKGSLHGYDIIDMNSLNPELGSEDDFSRLSDELNRYGMGWVQDIVPNHMCITSSENKWWTDILENGRSSMYSKFFDIDWEPVKKELRNKVLIPFLGDQYGNVLENQELKLIFDNGAFFICYYDLRFPVKPKTYSLILEHRIEGLRDILSEESPHFVELLSIITAIKHLPSDTETDAEKITERYREKEIIKKRISALYSESCDVKSFIDKNLEEFNVVKNDFQSSFLLDRLLSNQIYRLSHWRVATQEINYRRFFDVNELAAIRMEENDVFRETHKLVLRLVMENRISGIRVDHPDGLYDPVEYFRSLQKSCFLQAVHPVKGDAGPGTKKRKKENMMISSDFKDSPFYIVGEKILTKGEKMPGDWPVSGTTGYSFMNSLNGIFVETKNVKAFDAIYSRFVRSKTHFQDIVHKNKKLIMHSSMSSELNTLAQYLNRISEKDLHTRDFTLYSLTSAIKEVISCFPVYRTYINSFSINDNDRKYIELAVSKAKRKNPAVSESVFDFLRNVLLLNFPEYFEDNGKKEWLDFVMRFQQITGPVMAKGMEDTTFYVYNRLTSINEVGGDPERFGLSVEAFHGQNIERNKCWPDSMIATSTHDSKRSEDVRARINVLSEMPDEWKANLARWSRINKRKKHIMEGQDIPDRNEEYLFYQTLIGIWPFKEMDGPEHETFRGRIKDYMIKALREAKVNTSWINISSGYEDAVTAFIDKTMSFGHDNKFLDEFSLFSKKISFYGIYNALSQTLLKITCPGVPDFYQGTELWDFSLVDPDNRRPVDYSLRSWLFFEMKERADIDMNSLLEDLLLTKEDGRIKMFLTYRALSERQKQRELFEQGTYIPLETEGRFKDNIVAFVREFRNSWAVTIVPRLLTNVVEENEHPLGEGVWNDTYVILPQNAPSVWRDVITGVIINGQEKLSVGEVLKYFPCALLINRKKI
jgi:(1->4)-alpha-D-glucan 1-alpha-D-glucosylmutase